MPQSAQKSLLLQLPSQLLASPDDRTRLFVEWWQRMHHDPDPLVATALKFIEWADGDALAQRFVWEVCRWPQGRSSKWTFVCWMIDGDGMWTQGFPSKHSAIAYFRQSPDVVMASSPVPGQHSAPGKPIAAAS